MQENQEFQISADELGLLRQVVLREESLATLLRPYLGDRSSRVTIRLSRREAEQLRECLTTELSKIGFDADYRPNERGQMLENLIDRFCPR